MRIVAKSRTSLTAVLFLVVILSGAAWAEVNYIDNLRITVRRGPSLEHRIIAFLETDKEVELIRQEDGWALVRLPEGKTGWVLSRYLTDQIPAAARVQEFLAENKRLEQEISSLQAANQTLRQDLSEMAGPGEKGPMGPSPEPAATREELTTAVEMVRSLVAEEKVKLDTLQRGRDARASLIQWFLIGAGVTGLGMILGLLTSQLKRFRPL